jgi:hypothetical protein
MRLYIEADTLHAGRATREKIDLDKVAAYLARRGHSLAAAIAHGELSTPTRAKLLGIRAGLLAVETDKARERGLLR